MVALRLAILPSSHRTPRYMERVILDSLASTYIELCMNQFNNAQIKQEFKPGKLSEYKSWRTYRQTRA